MKEVVVFSWNKKGISIMIGYILLITGAVVMSAIVYNWMKTYVPTESVDCPDGVSMFVSDSSCVRFGDNYQLRLDIRNNGRFSIGGFFIRGTSNESAELATVDLSNTIVNGRASRNAVVFSPPNTEINNFLDPNNEIQRLFNLTEPVYLLELVPIRFQVIDNKQQLVSCSRAVVNEILDCESVVAICGDGKIDSGEECDDGNSNEDDGCNSECERTECTESCDNLGFECGSQTVCGGTRDCGTCALGFCNESGICEIECTNSSECNEGIGEICSVNNLCTLCGNGVLDDGEECDSVTGCGTDCLHEEGYTCILNECTLN
ncbi:MAG: DUF4215 domain-containing protein [Candidatus Pacearchaeota archaeon]|nr:DUF4215 domain-containing protein [Candidatus Pacearchaeota archaeon]